MCRSAEVLAEGRGAAFDPRPSALDVGFYLAAIGLLILSGCAPQRHASVEPPPTPAYGPVDHNSTNSGPKTIVTPGEGLDGKVAWINSNLRFAVVTFPLGQMPSVDQRLNVYRRGLKVGELRITGPQRDDSIVGDLIAGEAAAGDAVRDR